MKLPYKLQDVYDGEAQAKFTVISTFAGGVVPLQDIVLPVVRFCVSMSL